MVTAAVLVIGDEILSGRTQDANLAVLARFLGGLGIDLCEARFVPDIEAEIAGAVNALRGRYTYVFTTGGIGPTHDDITADSIGKAFGVKVTHHPEAMALLAARYAPGEFNESRQRMARVPDGAHLIKNPISVAPGFRIGNVFVMAGVPRIMQAMLDDIAPRLERGPVVFRRTVRVYLPEGRIAEDLSRIQEAHPGTAIGSYPFFAQTDETGLDNRPPGTNLEIRGRDSQAVDEALQAIQIMVRTLGVEAEEVTDTRSA